jgi:hypothetical protein
MDVLDPPSVAAAHRALRSQRWRERRARFVPDATVIDPRAFAVDVIADAAARAFVTRHHYSGSFPAARLSLGLFGPGQGGPARLVGVATFSVPINDRSVLRRTGLADPRTGADLGRFVLLDEVAGNGETWFLARAFRLLRREKPQIQAVIAYSDPLPRVGADGSGVSPGHIGGIYRDFGRGLAYRGRAEPRLEHLSPDGRVFSARAASKIRNGERGCGYAVDELVRRGAPPPSGGDLRGWYDGLVRSGFLVPRRHPGNHVYAFALTQAARLAGRALPRQPCPEARAVT